MKSLQVENLGEVFVFQRGSRFIRLPLYQLLLISDLHERLNTILEESTDIEFDASLGYDGSGRNYQFFGNRK